MQSEMKILAILRFLIKMLGIYDSKIDKKTQLTIWFYFVNIILITMSTQCIIELILDENRDIGQMCYVASMSGLFIKITILK